MSSSDEDNLSPGSVRLLRLTVRALLIGLGVPLVLLLLVIILQLAEMREAARLANAPSKTSLCREGDTFSTCDNTMLHQSFPAVKEKGALRVFIVGSSQAMGSPYVHQHFNHISRFFPNEGGLATWLKDYLVFAMPGRRIEIINAAKANHSKMTSHLQTLREILEKGSPDIIVVMGGNNEGIGNTSYQADNPIQRDAIASIIYPAYQATIQTMAREAFVAGVRTIFVTLPGNLRNQPSEKPLDQGLERLFGNITSISYDRGKREPVLEGACRELRSQWLQHRGNPSVHFFLARCLEYEKNVSQAYSEYLAARDLDYVFFHIRSVQNESIRALRGPGISVLDLEALMRNYAYNGIPGNDLFLDWCHMNLRGNKIAGFEIAREVLRLEGIPMSEEELRRAPLRDLNRQALWWLYWLKTVKWTLYRFFPSAWQQPGLRGKTITDSYRQAMLDINMLDKQIFLFQKGRLKPRGSDKKA